MGARVYSFDIFDTCIVRNFARPIDLFYQLYYHRHLNYPRISADELSSALANHRLRSEAKARANCQNQEDILIHEFYQSSERSLQLNLDHDSLLAAEIELELQSVKPILAIKNKLEQLRQNRQKIIFISDMYLPLEVIQKMLFNCQLALPEEPIYVSGEIGLTKHTGSLFKYVLAQEKIEPHQLYHHGDNIHSDVIVPRALGINAEHFTASQLNRYEKQMVITSHAPLFVRSQIAGVSRVARLMETDNSEIQPVLANLVTNIIAPLLVSYLIWIIQDAQQHGIEQLYFTGYGGKFLLAISQHLNQYLTIPACDYWDQQQSDSEIQTQLPSKLNWAIADLSWTLNYQRSLQQILTNLPTTHQVRAYSLGVSNGCLSATELINYRAFLIQDALTVYPHATQVIFRHRQIVEQLLLAVTNSLPLQRLVFGYVREISDTKILPRHLEELKRYALDNAIALLTQPTPAEARAIAQLQLTTNKSNSSLQPLLRPLGIQDLTKIVTRLNGTNNNPNHRGKIQWRAGAIALSHPVIRLGYPILKAAKQSISPTKLTWFYQLRFKLKQAKRS